jgi:hypothetical protein
VVNARLTHTDHGVGLVEAEDARGRAAFGPGTSYKLNATIDPDGVTLAVIQGLKHTMVEHLAEKNAEIAEVMNR